jgi:phosphopantothenate synthetase
MPPYSAILDTINGVTNALRLTEQPMYSVNGKVAVATADKLKTLCFDSPPIKRQAEFLMVTMNSRRYVRRWRLPLLKWTQGSV